MKTIFKRIYLWLYWCWNLSSIVSWDYSLIDNRDLTEEELDYADTIEMDDIIKG
jgi:hypothetical protein